MLTLHHLGISQSERVIWLLEELELPYALKHYTRDPVTRLSPPELKAVHPSGTAPLLTTEEGVTIAESGAIVQFILARYGDGRLAPAVQDADFAHYLYWFHFANGNLVPHLGRVMFFGLAGVAANHSAMGFAHERVTRALAMLNDRLAETPWLAGAEFSAADVMNVFGVTTMLHFSPWDLSPYPHILAWLERVAQRPAYQRAKRKGDLV
ncbi:glutathione S-transferase [Duganella sp. CY15W]|uniref:glutathione S-transferase family protein n=1 Tax=Duganella sp. CY15W TaxID=2692172 RepID=UPI0013690D07|nr:glutathione S-transferase family protein [Duganella sp. CY15W]MYM28897.1 glutathione S-transferase [Duganella sp. CY15W]